MKIALWISVGAAILGAFVTINISKKEQLLDATTLSLLE